MADQTEFVADTAAGVSPAAKKPDDTSKHAGDGSAFGGGGGSAFAHLTEDAENTAMWVSGAGWGVVASETEGDWAHTWSGHFGDGTIFTTVLTPDANAIYVGAVDEANQRLIVHGDGSLHWGDGAGPPDIHLSRDGQYSLTLGTPGNNEGGFQWWNNDDTGHAYYYMFAGNGSGASIQFDTRPGHSIISASDAAGEYADLAVAGANLWEIPGNGGGIRLTSPDGSQTAMIRLSDAGAVEVVA